MQHFRHGIPMCDFPLFSPSWQTKRVQMFRPQSFRRQWLGAARFRLDGLTSPANTAILTVIAQHESIAP